MYYFLEFNTSDKIARAIDLEPPLVTFSLAAIVLWRDRTLECVANANGLESNKYERNISRI